MNSEADSPDSEKPQLVCRPERALLIGTYVPPDNDGDASDRLRVEDLHQRQERRVTASGLDLLFDSKRVESHVSAAAVVLIIGLRNFPDTEGAREALPRSSDSFIGDPEAGLGSRYSILHFDLAKSTLTLRTDRFGVVPICYRIDGDCISFSDRADLVPGAQEQGLDMQAVYNYVHGHTIAAPRTIYRRVLRLEGASELTFDRKGSRTSRVWQPRFSGGRADNLAALKSRFLKLLAAAVRRESTGQKLGCFLSGGTDSSTVVGLLAQQQSSPVPTFSIGFATAGYDELEYARIAAKHFGTDHHEHYVTPDDLVEWIPRVAAFCDQPFGNSSVLPAFCCAHLARQTGIERMLAGDGGDELFGGNSRYARQKVLDAYGLVPAALRRGLLEPLLLRTPLRALPLIRRGASYVEQAHLPMPDRMEVYNLLDRFGAGQVFPKTMLDAVDTNEPRTLQRAVYAESSGAELVDRMLAYDWRFTLADTDLPKVHWATGLAGVDVGFPLLDDALVDFSLELPAALKVRGLKLRWFFKEALKDFLPPQIIAKKKHGFGLPFGPWLLEHRGLNDLARSSLRTLAERGVVRPALVGELFDRRLGEHAGYYGELVWILMMLEQWLAARAPDFALDSASSLADA